MSPAIDSVTHLLATFVVLLDAALIVVIVLLILRSLGSAPKFFTDLIAFFGRFGIWVAFILSLGSLLGSFFYSQIAGYAPCELCIIQRILMYPLVLILGIALWKKSFASVAASLSILFSSLGGLVAIYHYYGQMFNESSLPCAAAVVSCAKREFVEFGYITIPMMSLTAFVAIIVTLVMRRLA